MKGKVSINFFPLLFITSVIFSLICLAYPVRALSSKVTGNATYGFVRSIVEGVDSLITSGIISLPEVRSKFSSDMPVDSELPTPELLLKYGYPAESHTIKTEDGYILTMHRVSHSEKSPETPGKPVAYLQHGMGDTSANYVIAGPAKSLAYILADSGYDVWMGNLRGSVYSSFHADIKAKSGSSGDKKKYWNYSWHDMALNDLPAMFDFILRKTKQERLFYVGHSMGTTVFYALLAMKPEYNEKIQAAVMLAPVAFMSHLRSPARLMAPFAGSIQAFETYFGQYGQAGGYVDDLLAKYSCTLSKFLEPLCRKVYGMMLGNDPEQMNITIFRIAMGHRPAGVSIKIMAHYSQLIQNGLFAPYDYNDPALNLKHYGTKEVASYDLSKVTVPHLIMYADNDLLVAAEDVRILHKALTPGVGWLYKIPLKTFHHNDFIWANDMDTLCYDHLLSFLKCHDDNGSVSAKEANDRAYCVNKTIGG